MEKNVGNYEAGVRGVIAAASLALGVGYRNPLWLAFGLFTFVTAVTRTCAVNALLGIDTSVPYDQQPRRRLHPVPTIH